MKPIQKISPCLWFDDQGEEAARFYVSVFPDSRLGAISRYGDAGREFHHKPTGAAMTVAFVLAGQEFTALNGGPQFRFTEAISLQVFCDTQAEIDHFWERLSAGGDPQAQQCGWLKDRFGLSWQIVPATMPDMMTGSDTAAAQRVMQAMMAMKKLDLAALEREYRG